MANYTKGKIAIPNVTGNIVINITAVAQAQENSFPSKFFDTDGITLYNGLGYKTGYRFNSSRAEVASADANDAVTGYLDITRVTKITLSGATMATMSGYKALCYDASHSVITTFPTTSVLPNGTYTHDADDVNFRLPENAKYIRFMVHKDNCTGNPPALTAYLE